jgi:hypothetical protein
MRGHRTVASLLSIVGLTATVALAQNEPIKTGTGHERQGFWIGFGFGWGSGGATCSGTCPDRFGGGTFRLAIGGTVNRHFKVGGELHGWVNTNDPNLNESIGNASASVYYYPSTTGNFFLQGGLGYSTYSYDDGIDKAEAYGAASIIGIGYDIYLGRKFSLTPMLSYGAAWTGELTLNGNGTGSTFRPNFLSLTISPTWH